MCRAGQIPGCSNALTNNQSQGQGWFREGSSEKVELEPVLKGRELDKQV